MFAALALQELRTRYVKNMVGEDGASEAVLAACENADPEIPLHSDDAAHIEGKFHAILALLRIFSDFAPASCHLSTFLASGRMRCGKFFHRRLVRAFIAKGFQLQVTFGA